MMTMTRNPAPVLTVTFNPAIDLTVTVDSLHPGEVHRAIGVRHGPGGKGVNVSSSLADWGVPVVATGLLGAENPEMFERLFVRKNIADRFVRVPGETRTNLKIVAHDGTTDINLPGPPASPGDVASVIAAVKAVAGEVELAVLAGSLPNGCPEGIYADLIDALAEQGVRTVLDASGPPLAAALRRRPPFCVKPNRRELEAWTGTPVTDRETLISALRALRGAGVGVAVVSLGAEGAVFAAGGDMLRALPPRVESGSTVGAVDAMVAGLVAAIIEGLSLENAARQATAFAVAKLGANGADLPQPAAIRVLANAVRITEV
jgi:1-phosphofructokinase